MYFGGTRRSEPQSHPGAQRPETEAYVAGLPVMKGGTRSQLRRPSRKKKERSLTDSVINRRWPTTKRHESCFLQGRRRLSQHTLQRAGRSDAIGREVRNVEDQLYKPLRAGRACSALEGTTRKRKALRCHCAAGWVYIRAGSCQGRRTSGCHWLVCFPWRPIGMVLG